MLGGGSSLNWGVYLPQPPRGGCNITAFTADPLVRAQVAYI